MVADHDIEHAVRELSPLIESSICAVWIGSGLSNGLYPSWKQTIQQLCNSCGIPFPHDDDVLPTQEADFYMEKADECKTADPDEYSRALRSMFGPTSTQKRQALSLLIRLPVKGFVTTNYDPLLREEANLYTGPDHAFNVRAYPSLSTRDLSSSKTPIYHIHGAIFEDDEDVNIVLAKSEYEEAYGDGSLLPGFLKDLLTMQDMLFVGCSLDEPDMRKLFDQVHGIVKKLTAVSPTFTMRRRYILIAKRPDGLPSSREDERNEDERFKTMGITVLRYDPGLSPNRNHQHLDNILKRLCIKAKTYVEQPLKVDYGEDLPA